VGLVAAFLTGLAPFATGADGGWLDGDRASWNVPGTPVPEALERAGGGLPACKRWMWPAESEVDPAVGDRGRRLYGAYDLGWDRTLVGGIAWSTTGSPSSSTAFSPVRMRPPRCSPGSNGSLADAGIAEAGRRWAVFNSYTPDDPLRCRSSQTHVQDGIERASDGPAAVPRGRVTVADHRRLDQNAGWSIRCAYALLSATTGGAGAAGRLGSREHGRSMESAAIDLRRRGETRRREERARPSSPAFGRRLRPLREARGLNQKRLAELADVDASTISRLESGGRGVSREVVDRLAQALETTPDQYGELLRAAGFLPDEAAILLEEPELARLSQLLAADDVTADHRELLRAYLRLALSHAEALGYALPSPALFEPDGAQARAGER